MDAVKYLKEKHRMAKRCAVFCEECPLDGLNNGLFVSCEELEKEYPEKAVEIVEKWSEERPQKTYLMDFLEKFPNCEKDKDGIPEACRRHIYPLTSGKSCAGLSCSDCWNEPMEGNNV